VRATSPAPKDLLSAFATTEDGVFAVDDDERIVFWNGAAERILGYKPKDVIGKRCYDVVAGGEAFGHTDCGPGCEVMRLARKGRSSRSYDVLARTASADTRLLNISIVVLRGRRRDSTLAVHLFRDVSETRRVQMEVQRELAEAASISEREVGTSKGSQLTPRELEVLRLLTTGISNSRIAETLSISPITVRNHIEHVLAKLGVHSKLEAVVFAARHRIV
jgi:PAS domain S-box-containing protein